MSSMHLSHLRRWLLQSPPVEWAHLQLRDLLVGALAQGPVPQHIALVMDGNRRFARSRQIETVEGHNLGFEALARILEVCYKAGVKVVTIYAFSIENFKRSRHEVDALMALAKLKLTQLAQHGELLQRYGASVRVLGQRDLLRPDVQDAINRAVELTQDNTDAILNVCFPYTARDEMTTAVRNVVDEYCQPVPASMLRPTRRGRTFSKSHISHNLRSRGLSACIQDPPPPNESSSARPSSPSSSATNSDFEDSILSSATSQQASTPPNENESCTRASGSSTRFAHPEFDTSSITTMTPTSRAALDSAQPAHEIDKTVVAATADDAKVIPKISTTPPTSSPPLRLPDPETIDTDTLDAHMFTAGLPPVDLLIRTSGVERLSDFLLWQVHEQTDIVFLETLWPEFDLRTFLPVLVEWQWRRLQETKALERSGRRGPDYGRREARRQSRWHKGDQYLRQRERSQFDLDHRQD